MQGTIIPINSIFKNGLRREPTSLKNQELLVQSTGVRPSTGTFRSLDTLSQIDTSSISATWPFPQIFEFTHLTLIATENNLYQYTNPTPILTLVLSSIPSGTIFTFADFGPFIIGTNAAAIVYRDPDSGVWSLYEGCDIPLCSCVLNFNGQLIVGDPEKMWSLDIA